MQMNKRLLYANARTGIAGMLGREASTDLIAAKALAMGASQKQAELTRLVELVAAAKPATVLEIGTKGGGTLMAWCMCATDDALVVSLDLPDGSFGGRDADGPGETAEDLSRLERLARAEQSLVLLRGDSHEAAMRERVAGLVAGIDLLFIDGDHTYEGVKRDFEDYAPLVREGGLIAFHDIVEHPRVPSCEVDRFWAELQESHETTEFVVEGDERGWGPWGGIGVVSWGR